MLRWVSIAIYRGRSEWESLTIWDTLSRTHFGQKRAFNTLKPVHGVKKDKSSTKIPRLARSFCWFQHVKRPEAQGGATSHVLTKDGWSV